MSANEPTVTDSYTWVTAQVTQADKAMLLRLTELDSQENGTVGNMSATIRRLIRREAQRRLAPAGNGEDGEAVPA